MSNAQKTTSNFRFFTELWKQKIGIDGMVVLLLGGIFTMLLIVIGNFLPNTFIPNYFIYGGVAFTALAVLLLWRFEYLRTESEQFVLLYFGISVMLIVIYLSYLNRFLDHFIWFYWAMMISVSFGINGGKSLLRLWLVPLSIGLFAVYQVENPLSDKLQFYIWNPVISLVSIIAIYWSSAGWRQALFYERAFNDMEFRYRSLVDTMPVIFVVKDMDNNVLEVNQEHSNVMKVQKEKLEKKNLYDILDRDKALELHQEDLEIIKTQTPKRNQLEALINPNSNGEKLWLRTDKYPRFDKNGNAIGIMAFGIDVTAQVNAEREKALKETQFEQVFAEVPYGILLFDVQNYITEANKTLQIMTGYTQTELQRKPIDFLMVEEKGFCVTSSKADDGSLHHELPLQCADGKVFTAKWTISAVQKIDGTLAYFIAIIENITEKREADEQLKAYANALEQSNKDLEQFAYAASHDLKEPLRMVSSYVSLLARFYSKVLDERGLEFIGYATDGVERMNTLINDLLEFSRIGRGEDKNEWVDFDSLLMRAMGNLRVVINERKADIDVYAELQPLYVNATQFTMLLQNLIGNGIKYNKNRPFIFIKAEDAGDVLKFWVKDNGIGIDPKFSEKIFQVFNRLHTRRDYEGTGIGLAICKKIVQNHGGEIWLETSKEREGSTFCFTIAKKTPPEVLA